MARPAPPHLDGRWAVPVAMAPKSKQTAGHGDRVDGLGLGAGAGALFHLSRVLGMAPFKATWSRAPRAPRAIRSRGWEVYSVLVSLATLGMVSFMSYTIYNSLTGSFYNDLIGMSYMLKGMCGCCLHVVTLVRRRHVLRALNNVLHYEVAMSRSAPSSRSTSRGTSGTSRWSRCTACGEGVVVAAQMVAITSVCIWTFVLSWALFVHFSPLELLGSLVTNYLPILYLFTTDMQFVNLALLIHRQLTDLSQSARQLLQHAQQSPQEGASSLAQRARLLRARQECIYSSITKLSSAYSLQLLLSVTFSLQEATCDLYFIITSQYSSWRPVIAAWAVVYVSKLALLMTPCQWVESEGEVIAEAVNSALQIRHMSRVDREELEEFQAQLAHLKMRFSAGGVFPLDYSQLQKVISAITTYLVILLQMQGRPTKGKPTKSDHGH